MIPSLPFFTPAFLCSCFSRLTTRTYSCFHSRTDFIHLPPVEQSKPHYTIVRCIYKFSLSLFPFAFLRTFSSMHSRELWESRTLNYMTVSSSPDSMVVLWYLILRATNHLYIEVCINYTVTRMSIPYATEKQMAIAAVRRAYILTGSDSVFNKLVKNERLMKDDKSPVTAVIYTIIFPYDPIVGSPPQTSGNHPPPCCGLG